MSQLLIRASNRLPPGVEVVGSHKRLSDGADMWLVEITTVDPLSERRNKQIHTAYNFWQKQANCIDLHG